MANGQPAGGARRALRIVLVVLVVLLPLGAGLAIYLSITGAWKIAPPEVDRHAPSTPAEVASIERKERETPVADLAPAPLPTSLPLRGEAGTRPDGYPAQWVDQPGLRSLLFHGKLDDLTRYIEELQAAFEADPKKEYWPNDAGDAFDTADPALEASLDAWIAAKPESFAPWLARGVHRLAVGFAKRGGRAAKDTHEDDFAGMREAHAAARGDFEKALALRPKLAAAARGLQRLANVGASAEAKKAANERAFAICPTCFQPRVAAMVGLTPRWGGSVEQMAAIATAAPVASNARLGLLLAEIDVDASSMAHLKKDLDGALAAADKAVTRGAYFASLKQRAEVRWGKKDLDGALRDANDAFADRPSSRAVREVRLGILAAKEEWRAAADDLVHVLRVDSTSREARRLRPYVVSGLRHAAAATLAKGDRDGALDLLDLAAGLAPFNRSLQEQRASIIAPPGLDGVAVVDAARQAVAASPGDFRAVQRLDYLLAKQGKLEEILGVWSAYLKLQPDDGRAYLERNGTYINLRQMDAAMADAKRACELGISEGCGRVRGLAALPANSAK